MEFESFSLKNREEVSSFENLLGQYLKERGKPLVSSYISLSSVYASLQKRKDGGRVFTAILDIQINFVLLYCDLHSMAAIWNSLFSKGKLEGGSILDNPAKFYGKMDIHRFNTSYILRYRALWDKLMGLLVLLYAPSEYDAFCKANSKKKIFKSIAGNINQLSDGFVVDIEKMLQKFDNGFRTAEAHGTGILRKYSFTMESIDQNPQIELIGYWNILNEFIKDIGSILK